MGLGKSLSCSKNDESLFPTVNAGLTRSPRALWAVVIGFIFYKRRGGKEVNLELSWGL